MLDQYEAVLTVADIQEILGIGRNMAYQLLNTGAIPAIRIGKKWRIPKDAVLHYLGQWKNKKRSFIAPSEQLLWGCYSCGLVVSG